MLPPDAADAGAGAGSTFATGGGAASATAGTAAAAATGRSCHTALAHLQCGPSLLSWMGTPITTGGAIVVPQGKPESTGTAALTSDDTGTAVTSAGAVAAARAIGAWAGTNGMASSRFSCSSLSRLLDLEKPASIFFAFHPASTTR